jgi:hypothetical protein
MNPDKLFHIVMWLAAFWFAVLLFVWPGDEPAMVNPEPSEVQWEDVAFDDDAIENAHEALIEGRFGDATYWLKCAFEPDLSEYRAEQYRKWLEERAG